MTDKQLLNFRCPGDLVEAIDALGRERYPAVNKNGCDRSKTLIDIISAGIQALTDGSVVIPIQSDAKQTEVRQSDVDVEALKAELQAFISQSLNERVSDVDKRIEDAIAQRMASIKIPDIVSFEEAIAQHLEKSSGELVA